MFSNEENHEIYEKKTVFVMDRYRILQHLNQRWEYGIACLNVDKSIIFKEMDARETDFSRTMIWWKTSWKVAEYDRDVRVLKRREKREF